MYISADKTTEIKGDPVGEARKMQNLKQLNWQKKKKVSKGYLSFNLRFS